MQAYACVRAYDKCACVYSEAALCDDLYKALPYILIYALHMFK